MEVAPAQPDIVELAPAETITEVFAAAKVWLAKTDTLALAILRETLEEREEVRERAVGGSSEARRELREIDKQIISQMSQLGFDPSARARLGLTEVRAKSKLEELRSKQSGSGANGQPQGDPR